jgi:hypothetical protein
MFVPTRRTTSQIALEERLNFIERITVSLSSPVLRQSRPNLGTVPAKVITAAGAAKPPHLCRFPDSLALTTHHGPRQFDDSTEDRFQSPRALW